MANSPVEFYPVISYNDAGTEYTTRVFTDRKLAEKYVDLGRGRRFMATIPVTYSGPEG